MYKFYPPTPWASRQSLCRIMSTGHPLPISKSLSGDPALEDHHWALAKKPGLTLGSQGQPPGPCPPLRWKAALLDVGRCQQAPGRCKWHGEAWLGCWLSMKKAVMQEKTGQAHRAATTKLCLHPLLTSWLCGALRELLGTAQSRRAGQLSPGTHMARRHLWAASPSTGNAACPGERVQYPPTHISHPRLGLTRVTQEVSPPWAPIMYRTSKAVVAMKQNTDTNITQPWTRGMGTRDEAMRIHTRPPKTCRGREGRGEHQSRRAHIQEGPDLQVTLGHQGQKNRKEAERGLPLLACLYPCFKYNLKFLFNKKVYHTYMPGTVLST